MPDAAKRRFLDRSASTPTLIGAGSRIEGDLHCPGDLALAGEVIGKGEIDGLFTLAESGKWQGELRCEQAVIAGQMSGNFLVRQKLEIRQHARIEGKVSAQQIVIIEGAIVEAEITVLSGQAVQRVAEKRER
jgi:cytoskeletal protein CcmA (bactofilin family)